MKVRVATLFTLLLALSPLAARADVTLEYTASGQACSADFERVQLKGPLLRSDGGRDGQRGAFIYDSSEKLAWFLDHTRANYLQVEVDEDAIDFQSDVMGSMHNMIKNQSGVDPFEVAKAICPQAFDRNAAGTRGGKPVDCGLTPKNSDGKPMTREEMIAAARRGEMPGFGGGNQQEIAQRMMQAMQSGAGAKTGTVPMQAGNGVAAMPGVMAVTPQQFAQMRQGAAQGQPEPARDVDQETGQTDNVNGIACGVREHRSGEQVLRRDCMANLTDAGLSDVEAARIERSIKVMGQWAGSMRRLLGNDPSSAVAENKLLVQRVCYADGKQTGSVTLQIKRDELDEAQFQPPANYQRMQIDPGNPGAAGAATKH